MLLIIFSAKTQSEVFSQHASQLRGLSEVSTDIPSLIAGKSNFFCGEKLVTGSEVTS